MKFFLLDTLKTFHGILGNDTMKILGAIIDVKNDTLILENKRKIKIHQLAAQAVNTIGPQVSHMTESQKIIIKNLVQSHKNLFADPDTKLAYTTKVVGEIRTSSDSPVYGKHYPYPASLRQEVEKQINEMLEDGIIRPSRSPYNAPVWVVPKKSGQSEEKKYRLVIDYRKLNDVTISDRYPIPEIGEIIAQLGDNKYFSVLDLKSGFHQIPLKDTDIEKTAFAVNGGKYEFTRLPFGLKNSPSIFQRALDDILREYIGKICYVYVDDIIVFSKNEVEHGQNLEKVFSTLQNANMRVQIEKCHFFKNEVDFLGYTISQDGVKTNIDKIKAIAKFPIPKTLKDLRSFLGMTGYYRRFIRDYAKIAKPLTILLRGEEGRISKNKSSRTAINLDKKAINAFEKLKNTLISRDVTLAYPDFGKEFQLTTDASSYAIGAVLEQNHRPITFISRTLTKTEENYATNEREMLAIVWALQSLRHYLYGYSKVVIYTDHQPLSFSNSVNNHNAKLKRWRDLIGEYNHEIKYKPGVANVVADALSRAPAEINSLSSTATIHSDESSSHNLIFSVEAPINVFKNQLFLLMDETDSDTFEIPFPTYHRHIVKRREYTEEQIIAILTCRLDPRLINGIFTSEEVMGKIQNIYPTYFSSYKVRFTRKQVDDVTSELQQNELITLEHKRAHRDAKENKIQILKNYFFPQAQKKIQAIVQSCQTCKESKYDRHPPKGEIQPTPIPKYPGEIVHVDIYITEKNSVLTGIDKFSKYAQVKILQSRAAEDIKNPLREMLIAFGMPKWIIMDNERSLSSAAIKFMLEDQLKISVHTTAPYASTSNGQVERFHSTLSEILRCLKKDNGSMVFEDLLFQAVQEYNKSIHSVTKEKPIDIFFRNTIPNTPEDIRNQREEIIQKIQKKQLYDLEYHNKNKNLPKHFRPGEIVHVKIDKRLGSKLTPRYKKEKVAENKNTTIKTQSGKIIHKNNIKT